VNNPHTKSQMADRHSAGAAPRVTIGLPVYNGAAHLEAAMRSLLDQSLREIELVVCDNASTDSTASVAEAAAAVDARVRVIRHSRNLGAVGNFIFAAEQATAPYFCWAAHDDLRHPRFLETLVRLLESHPDAGLAFCAVRNMDPDGALRDERPETRSLREIDRMGRVDRLLAYLRECPGTPYYGLFRTDVLHGVLDVLRRAGCGDGPPTLGLDMMFLASVLKSCGAVMTEEPLLHFRRGGLSHRVDIYRGLPAYLTQIVRFASGLKRATHVAEEPLRHRVRLALARWWFLVRYMLTPAMRRMTWHYVSSSAPSLNAIRTWWTVKSSAPIRRLARRVRSLPDGQRIVLVGAGKHSRRNLAVICGALGRRAAVVGLCDDAATKGDTFLGLPIVTPAELSSLRPTLLLVSSDTYEAQLMQRARAIAPAGVAVWAIYDPTLEATASSSEASTSARNEVMASIASTPGAVAAGREAA
jgi:glycosyltransferase involved in cell wall biosynthesis